MSTRRMGPALPFVRPSLREPSWPDCSIEPSVTSGAPRLSVPVTDGHLRTQHSADGFELPGWNGAPPADRVFAVIDSFGQVEPWTAAASSAGRMIGSGSIDASRGGALSLSISAMNASLLYDGVTVASGNPFTIDPLDADAKLSYVDQVITIGRGTEFRGAASINDQAIGCPDLLLTDRTITTPATFSGCQRVLAGPHLEIQANSTIRAGIAISVRGPFAVTGGSTLKLETDSSLIP